MRKGIDELDKITNIIKDEIKRQYKNLRRFSEESGIPYSTLSNALARICKLLNLRQFYDEDIIIFNDKFKDICAMLSEIDEKGIHTVETVLKMEYNRCIEENTAKEYNGISFESEKVAMLK